MKITELQINDWVYEDPKKGFPMQVTCIFKDGDLYLDFEGNEGDVWESNVKYIAPIPIDENILKNSGFHEVEKGKGFSLGSVILIKKNKGDNTYLAKVSSIVTNFTTCEIYIRYVHELQHIFRMFGGKELEVKL